MEKRSRREPTEVKFMVQIPRVDDLVYNFPSSLKGMSEVEWKARLELAAVYRLTDYYGWTSVVYNHITLRVPDTNTF